MVFRPAPLMLRAREHLERFWTRDDATTPLPPPGQDESLGLERSFSDIAADYGGEAAEALHGWARWHIGDPDLERSLLAWGQLLSELARGALPDTQERGGLSPDAREQAARIVQAHRDPERARATRHHIREAGAAPATAWEGRLDAAIRHAAGDSGHIIGAAKAAMDLAENIAGEERTLRALRALRAQLSPDDCARLLDWGRDQSTGLGIPVDAVGPLPDPV